MMRRLAVVLAVLVLSACQTTVPRTLPSPAVDSGEDHKADYAGLARSGGAVYTLDPAASTVRIYVFRGGAAARAGHNHVLAAPDFDGYVYAPDADASQARFDLRVRLAALQVDDPAWRAQTGGAFSGERSASDIDGTLRNLLGERGLDAARFPVVTLKSVSMTGDWPVLIAEVAVTIKDVTRTQPVVLRVQHDVERLTASGTLVLRQSDFGIVPFSILGGLLAVQDAVAISFELIGRRQAF